MRFLAKLLNLVTAISLAISFFGAGYRFAFTRFLKRHAKCNLDDASSIGIIGSSDGPSSIFVAKPGQLQINLKNPSWAITILGIISSYIVGKSAKETE